MRVLLTALYSERYPSSGESHGLSVLAGQLRRDCNPCLDQLTIIDMVAYGRDLSEELVDLANGMQPDLIGISVTYGTYSKLARLVPMLRRVVRCQIVYGGALASYLAQDLLKNVDPAGIVCVGEGELALAKLLNAGLDRGNLENIDNLAFLDNEGRFLKTKRTLSPTTLLARPDRAHIAHLIPQGIQLYAEASRGCSWARCTFCLRGLLDIKGEGREFRRMPSGRLAGDILTLKELGAASLTFADEDLLGQDISQAVRIVEMLEAAFADSGVILPFDASATVHSIYSDGYSPSEQREREQLVARLRKCGLRKIFLGVESGATTQLRRFVKGHSREEAGAAIALLRQHDILVELGWIMFDPLCTLAEVRENIQFLLDHDAVDAASYLFNELRLQRDTRFERLLETHAVRTGENLKDAHFDPDTLSYEYRYADSRVAELVELTRSWAETLRQIHYPLKNLTRYGAGGALGGHLDRPRHILSQLRIGMCEALLGEIDRLEGVADAGAKSMDGLLRHAAHQLIEWADEQPSELRELELVRTLLGNAHALIIDQDSASNSRSASKV